MPTQAPSVSQHLLRAVFCAAAFFALVIASFAATAADFLYAAVAKTGAEPNDLPYRFLVPTGYDAAQEYPLIVFLHGSGERGNDNQAQLNNNANGALALVSSANQSTAPCFMLAPQASVAEGWNANTLDQVVRAIAQLEKAYPIDPDRIYVTGLSMGGAGTWQILTRYPFLFAAAVPMNGWGSGSYEKLVGVPIWAFHAVDDGTVGVAGSDNAVSAVRQAGGRALYTRYATGGHYIWPTAYANAYLRPWMLAQRRNQPLAGVPIVSITSPAPHIMPPPAVATLNVTGTASVPGGVTKVNWTFTPWTGGAGVDTSTYALASGTTSWTVANAAVAGNSTLFLAVATGPSWATGTGGNTGGGVTTLNDFLWTVPTGANVTAPTVAITTPTGTGILNTTDSLLSLAGTAAAAGGKTVKAITWRNDRGGEGIGVGTTAWNTADIDLQPGDNLITVTVRDSASITAQTMLLVHATFGGFPGWRVANFTGTDRTNDTVSGPLADPDSAGVTNLQRYGFGLAAHGPVAASTTALMVDDAGQRYLAVRFNRLAVADDVAYTVESSSDLTTWATVATLAAGTPIEQTVRDTVMIGSATRRFLRVRVDLIPVPAKATFFNPTSWAYRFINEGDLRTAGHTYVGWFRMEGTYSVVPWPGGGSWTYDNTRVLWSLYNDQHGVGEGLVFEDVGLGGPRLALWNYDNNEAGNPYIVTLPFTPGSSWFWVALAYGAPAANGTGTVTLSIGRTPGGAPIASSTGTYHDAFGWLHGNRYFSNYFILASGIPFGMDEPWQGSVKDMRIIPSVLNAAQLATLSASQTVYPGAVADWGLTEGSMADRSSHGWTLVPSEYATITSSSSSPYGTAP